MMKVEIIDVYSSDRRIADAARTTIKMEASSKKVQQSYLRKMYISEHSPSRLKQFHIKMWDIPYWIAMHFRTHHIGVLPFISTQRTDRTGVDRKKLPQDALVDMEWVLNVQAIINISKLRLCKQASKETTEAWQQILNEIKKVDPVLYSVCVPSCIYRGFCPEFYPCGYSDTPACLDRMMKYRLGRI